MDDPPPHKKPRTEIIPEKETAALRASRLGLHYDSGKWVTLTMDGKQVSSGLSLVDAVRKIFEAEGTPAEKIEN